MWLLCHPISAYDRIPDRLTSSVWNFCHLVADVAPCKRPQRRGVRRTGCFYRLHYLYGNMQGQQMRIWNFHSRVKRVKPIKKCEILNNIRTLNKLQSHLAFCILHLAFWVLQNTPAIKFVVHSNCCRNISIYWESINVISSKDNQISGIYDLSYHLRGNSLYCFPQQINMVMVYIMVYPCLKFYLSTAVAI